MKMNSCYSEWEEEGNLWVQKVSSTPATRLDVLNLQVKKFSIHFVGTFGSNASKKTGQRNWDLPHSQRII
jgi:hypothetical protein